MGGAAPEKQTYQESAKKQIARLTLERAQITLGWASVASGTKTTLLYAPSADRNLQAHHELVRCAMNEAGLVCPITSQINVAETPDIPSVTAALNDSEMILVLDDHHFRTARLVMPYLLRAHDVRHDLVVVRLGDVTAHEDLEFYLQSGPWMHL